jgi:hypothetical protein
VSSFKTDSDMGDVDVMRVEGDEEDEILKDINKEIEAKEEEEEKKEQ